MISNPDTREPTSYKLAAPGHDLGSLLTGAPSAAVGRVRGLPDLIETTVRVRDLDNGREDVSTTRIADETDVGLPSGGSPLGFIAPLAIFDAGARVLSGTPARQSDAMCVRIRLRERRRPLGFCNRYVTDGGAGFEGIIALAQQLQAEDLGEAIRLIESYKAGRIHVESVEADVDLRRGLRQAYMLSASARGGPVAAGDVVPVSLRLRVTRGPLRTMRFRLPVPRHLKPGTHAIRLAGTAEDSLETLEGGEEIIIELVEDVEDEPGAGLGPRSMKALAAKVAALSRFDGVRARFGSGRRSKPVRVFRHPELRISGKTVLRLRLSRPRRP